MPSPYSVIFIDLDAALSSAWRGIWARMINKGIAAPL